MAQILDIAHVGVGVPDRQRFEQFAAEMLGFPTFRSQDHVVTYVRWDGFHHRLALYDAPGNELRYIAYDVGSQAEMEEWAKLLEGKGLAVRRGSPAECAQRQAAGFIEFQDPDGHPIALGYGFELGKGPVRFTRGLSVLRTGHTLLTSEDTKRAHDFYTGALGFRLSDWVYVSDEIRLCFLRVNPRHHTLALAPCSPGAKPRLQHIMVEVESLDDVMRSYHYIRGKGGPIGMGPGKHPNCETIHTYVPTPGGFAIEFGWGHRRLDDARHQPTIFPVGTPVDVWGGEVQSEEFVLG
ncbi:MAG: VOC family protein [Nitrospinae bacterium]|nr:VOC family protein [Nitrospinota bacterium]